MQPVQGLHHITAVARDPRANLDFYHHILGQRLVKRTVNFDDPGTYHFYFGDRTGSPGTLMTFFPWKNIRRGRLGNGETAAVSYAASSGSLGFWHHRLTEMGFTPSGSGKRFGEETLRFEDPDGIALELVETEASAAIHHWEAGPIPEENALRGFHSVSLWMNEIEKTAGLLTDFLGYEYVGSEGNTSRFKAASKDLGTYLDLVHRPGMPFGQFGAGSIHHIAFRTVDDSEQLEYLSKLRAAGFHVTTVKDRQYFHSIYFRSPGGVLFEIATDAPGFLYDEPEEELGQSLKLPAWYEPNRAEIEALLPPFRLEPSAFSYWETGHGS